MPRLPAAVRFERFVMHRICESHAEGSGEGEGRRPSEASSPGDGQFETFIREAGSPPAVSATGTAAYEPPRRRLLPDDRGPAAYPSHRPTRSAFGPIRARSKSPLSGQAVFHAPKCGRGCGETDCRRKSPSRRRSRVLTRLSENDKRGCPRLGGQPLFHTTAASMPLRTTPAQAAE